MTPRKIKAPKGYSVKREHDGHLMDGRGFRVEEGQEPRKGLMRDGAIDVFWFDEDEPFVMKTNDGTGPNASEYAKDMARAGTPLEGPVANGELKPIKDGWYPPIYLLTKKDAT